MSLFPKIYFPVICRQGNMLKEKSSARPDLPLAGSPLVVPAEHWATGERRFPKRECFKPIAQNTTGTQRALPTAKFSWKGKPRSAEAQKALFRRPVCRLLKNNLWCRVTLYYITLNFFVNFFNRLIKKFALQSEFFVSYAALNTLLKVLKSCHASRDPA